METYEKIRSLRRARQWSQKDMAEKLEMSVNGYSKIERGESKVNLSRLQQISEIFGVPLAELIPQNDGNIVLMINEGDHYQGSFYSSSQALEQEVERLQAQLAQKDTEIRLKDALLAQQKRELDNLQDVLTLLKKRLT